MGTAPRDGSDRSSRERINHPKASGKDNLNGSAPQGSGRGVPITRAKLPLKAGGVAIPGLHRVLGLLPPDGSPIRQKDLKEAAKEEGIAWSTVKRQLDIVRPWILVLETKDVDERGQPEVTYRLATSGLLPIDARDRGALVDVERLKGLVGSARPEVALHMLEGHIVSELMVLRLFGLRVLLGAIQVGTDAEARDMAQAMLHFFLERRFLNLVETLRALPEGAFEMVDNVTLDLLLKDLDAMEAGIERARDAADLLDGPEAAAQRGKLETTVQAIRSLRSQYRGPPILRGMTGPPDNDDQDGGK